MFRQNSFLLPWIQAPNRPSFWLLCSQSDVETENLSQPQNPLIVWPHMWHHQTLPEESKALAAKNPLTGWLMTRRLCG